MPWQVSLAVVSVIVVCGANATKLSSSAHATDGADPLAEICHVTLAPP